MTLGLVQRQRTRKTLVRVGRARSWAARPGESGYGAAPGSAAAAPTANYEGFDDDRIVERRPGIGQVPAESDSDSGGSGWGAPRQTSPSFGGSVYGGSGQSGSGLIGSGQGGGPSFGGSGSLGGHRPTGSGFGDSSRGGSGQGRPL
jgi:hypothetical protein